MMFIYTTLSLILPVIALAYPPLDHEQHNPVIVRGAAATPEPTPLPNPLPDEVDGVLPDGTLANPVIMPNLTDNSCWTKPNTTNIDSSSPYYKPDTCQVCAMQGGVGPNAWYAAWVRDANNTAVGDQPAVNLGPATSIGRNVAFAAAGSFLTMGVDPNKDPGARSAVGMMWGYQPGWQSGSQTYFAPMTPLNSTNCTSAGGTQGDTVVYFQCHFYCGPAPAPEPLIGPVAERRYLEDDNPSISDQQSKPVEKRSQTLQLVPLPAETKAVPLDGIDAVIKPGLDDSAKTMPRHVSNATHVAIRNRQAPVGLGVSSGIFISTFSDKKCKNVEIDNYELLYHVEIPQSLQSFSLSSALGPDDSLGYSAEDPCTGSVYEFDAKDTTQGCHAVSEGTSCMMIWIN